MRSCGKRCNSARRFAIAISSLCWLLGYPYLGPRVGGFKARLPRNPLTWLAELLQTNIGKINSTTAAARSQAGESLFPDSVRVRWQYRDGYDI